MHSWCLFNAYHSAYLGAKGILAILGVSLPNLAGRQIVIDLFPERLKTKKAIGSFGASPFQDFLAVSIPHQLDQRYLWEVFQHVLRISKADCWNLGLRQEIITLSYEEITPPRNHFLYKVQFWPLNDLTVDGTIDEMNHLFGTELTSEGRGFLLRLCFSVYCLFEQLMLDLSKLSAVIKEQVDASRCLSNPRLPELACYSSFISQIESGAGQNLDT
jgi:hypothetical protein